MTEQELQEIKERNEKRTQGEWRHDIDLDDKLKVYIAGRHELHLCDWDVAEEEDHATAAFIAHAPADITALLAEVERLRQEIEPYNRMRELTRRPLPPSWQACREVNTNSYPISYFLDDKEAAMTWAGRPDAIAAFMALSRISGYRGDGNATLRVCRKRAGRTVRSRRHEG